MKEKVIILCIVGIISLVGNWIGFGVTPIEALPGVIIMIIVALAGYIITNLLPVKLPAVLWISLLAVFVSTPIFPGHDMIVKAVGKIDFMTLATPILAYAGLSFGKDIDAFKKLSWRIVVIALVVLTGSYLLAAVFSEITLRFF
ncbi:hypothetical protein [Scopulibacillus cellulosilyticus]|uniref:DUF340 domain-containing protein n=1 Tax=Scopulibacillus cellulosilyticus TaxID=2665665 RepID=A0ABW2Q1J4_9BACL